MSSSYRRKSFDDDDVLSWSERGVSDENSFSTKAKRFLLSKLGSDEAHKEAIDRLVSEHTMFVKRMDASHKDEVRRIQEAHFYGTQKMQNDHGTTVSKYKFALDNAEAAVTTLKEHYRRELDKLTTQYNADTRRNLASFEAQRRDWLRDMNQLKTETDHARDIMLIQHNEEVDRRKDEVSQLSTALISKDADAYKAHLFTFDDNSQKPDEHIKASFMQIEALVDDLGRLRWKDDQKVWTENVLDMFKPTENRRVMRMHILKDTIWSILHQYVFCSPFRVFGGAGQVLEEQWNESCGKEPGYANGEYTWPAPSILTERWRYFTIRECREILEIWQKSKLSEHDPRTKIWKGYRASLRGLVERLMMVLGEMVIEESLNAGFVEKLAEEMAAKWLEFTMYRCRIVLALTGSARGSPQDKVRQARKGHLSLTIAPSLGRFGDVKGFGLETYSVIAGCSGDRFDLVRRY